MDITFGQDWFEYIKYEIQEKYTVEQPAFIINGMLRSHDYITQWMDNVLFERRWVKYKHVSSVTFELKSFFPDPSSEVCKNIIEESFAWLEANTSVAGGSKAMLYRWGYSLYTRTEITEIFLYELKAGCLDISLYQSVESDVATGRPIITVSTTVGIGSEMYPWIKTGHLVLEYHD